MSAKINVVPIEEDTYGSVLEFLREYFYPNEPCAKALDLCPHGYRIPALESHILGLLRQRRSLAAVNPDEPKEIMGVIIVNQQMDTDKNSEEEKEDVDRTTPAPASRDYPQKFKRLDRFFQDLCTDFGRQKDLHALLEVNRIIDVFVICTRPDVQGQGVGGLMFQECLKNAASSSSGVVKCMALSAYTQRICRRFEFRTLFRVAYEDYEQDGVKLFSTAQMGDHTHGELLVKNI